MPIDYSKYPPNWKAEIVPAVRKRSGDKCELCGLPNKSEVWSYKLRVLDVDGRYKLKTFWTNSESDILRLTPFVSPSYTKKTKVVLTVAHLDHDETNWDVELNRLRHMCQYCHLNYDAKEKYKRSLKKVQQ